MRQRLLSQPIHSTSLHKLLVLITMLITLPLSAWGQGSISYGISIGNTPLRSDNTANYPQGVSYVHNSDGSGTLTLNGASLTDKIRISRAEALTIELIGANSIHPTDSSAIKADFGTGTAPTSSPSLIFKGEGHVTLTPGSTYPAIGSLNVNLDTYGMYADGSLTTNGTPVIVAKKYDITVAGAPVTSFNATTGIAAGNGKVYYDATNNILTLDGAEVVGMIKTELENLTIKLKGNNNTITTNNSNNGIYSDKNTGTLTFTKEGTNASLTIASNVSVIRGFASLNLENSGLYTKTSTPYKIKSNSSYPRFTDATKAETDTTAITNIVFCDEVTYQLWVKGTQVTRDNASNVTSTTTSTVTYNATDNILTLNGASIDGRIINNLDELKIEFIGTNSLTGTSGYINSINNSAALKLKGMTNSTVTTSTLSLTNTVGAAAVGGFASVTLDGAYVKTTNSCSYVSGNTRAYMPAYGATNYPLQSMEFTTTHYYPLWVNSTQVSEGNKDDIFGDGPQSPIQATFNPASNALSLNGLSCGSSNGIESGLESLTIYLNGNNSITTTTANHYNPIYSHVATATLKIQKAEGATSGELRLGSTDNNPVVIKGFASVDYPGLNFVSKTGTTPNGDTTKDALFSSATIYPLWIGGDMVTEANKSFNGTTSGTLVYDGNSNTITMTDYVSTFKTGHAIETGINGLIVKLVGSNNAITCNDVNGYAFYNGSGNTDASIQFVKDDANSKLTLQTTPTNPFGGFANGSITYNGLVYYPTGKYIAIPTAPTMTEDNDKVKMDRDNYEGGTIAIKYSIAYADGKTADITDATYSAPFAMAAPGTVTAWVEANGANSDETKGKYFGFKDAPFTMKAGDTKTVELIPAFEASDNIGYNATGTYESDATGVATFTGGTITAVAIGTATVTANIDYSSNTTPVVILNPNKKVTAVVNVGVVPSITFQDGMQYATYCNTTGTDMTVPAGLTAYAITGVNENVVTLAEVNFLPKVDGTTYVPLLLKRDDTSTTVGLALEATGGTRPTTNYLIYNNTGAAINVSDNWYVLYKNEFIKATGSIPDGKCYLDLTGVAAPAPARSLGIDSDGTTDIHLVNSEEGIVNSEVWYDLQGRRIQQPTKAGLYIKNGKKVIVNTK